MYQLHAHGLITVTTQLSLYIFSAGMFNEISKHKLYKKCLTIFSVLKNEKMKANYPANMFIETAFDLLLWDEQNRTCRNRNVQGRTMCLEFI